MKERGCGWRGAGVGRAGGHRWARQRRRRSGADSVVTRPSAVGREFDALARDLAQGVSRRQILLRLAGTLAAGLTAELFGWLGLDPSPAAAAAAPTPCSSSKAGACLDQAQLALASALVGCFPVTVDQASVGFYLALLPCIEGSGGDYELGRGQCMGAGAGCPGGRECSGDLCCPAGQAGCGSVCCGAGQSCVNGQCSSGGTTISPGNCPSGESLCGSACVNLQSDVTNCGSCGQLCFTGQSCVNGRCMLTCPAGLTACGGACVNLGSDPNNCGGCGTRCPAGQSCSGGRCGCPTGQTACSGACVNVQTDPNNCGQCGQKCGSTQSCAGGQCVCPFGMTACGSTCVDTRSDPNNCGKCGTHCPAASPECCGGACVDVRTDRNNCGACGQACDSNNPLCCGGLLGPGTTVCCPANTACCPFIRCCPAGTACCSAAHGYRCAHLETDTDNCGKCGIACRQGGCASGRCCVPGGGPCRAGGQCCSGQCILDRCG